MRRKAVIICNPGVRGNEHYCEGVNVDRAAYTSFLKHPCGGSWFDEEILHLFQPSAATVELEMSKLSFVDFAMVIFSGHGDFTAQTGQTWLDLGNYQLVPAGSITDRAPKQITVIDCCREIREFRMALKTSVIERSAAFGGRSANAGASREYFESLVTGSPNGRVTLWSCSPGEKAGDDSENGGYYSSCLRRVSLAWHNHEKENWISGRSRSALMVTEAHDLGTLSLIDNYPASQVKQNPRIHRRPVTANFPFAVFAS